MTMMDSPLDRPMTKEDLAKIRVIEEYPTGQPEEATILVYRNGSTRKILISDTQAWYQVELSLMEET